MININEPEYDELVRQSTKGSKDALDKLFAIGVGHLVNNPVKAAKTFKDSAISYRIAAFRNAAQLETAQNEIGKLVEDIDIFKEWISIFPNGYVALPKIVQGLDRETIEAVMYGNCHYPSDPEVIRIFLYLDLALEKHNKVFARINGYRTNYLCEMMLTYFGLESKSALFKTPLLSHSIEDILTTIDVRVGLDLLAHKIEAKFQIEGKQVQKS